MVNQLYISYADGESTSVNHPIFLNISYIMVQSFKNAIVSPSSFCIFSILKFYLKFWIDRVEEGKQHRNHANKSEDATLRFGGKNVGSAKDLEIGISLFCNFWYGNNDWFSPECSSGTGSIDLGCWSSWESHKVLSYERRNGTSQGAH